LIDRWLLQLEGEEYATEKKEGDVIKMNQGGQNVFLQMQVQIIEAELVQIGITESKRKYV
jgi:hypothetical protein